MIDGGQTVGDLLLLAHEKSQEAMDAVSEVASAVARCNPYMAEAPMKEAGNAVVAVDELEKVLRGIAEVVRAV